MATTDSIPIASFGGNEAVAKELKTLLLPEYDIVHISLDLPTALSELPALCNGQLDTPSACSLGSNASQPDISQRRVPRAIVFGGSVTDEDYKAVVEAVNNRGGELPVIKMVRVTKGDVLGMGGKGPEPGVVAMAVRGRLVAEGVVRGERLN